MARLGTTVLADPGAFAAETARFAETDLLCYRAPGPPKLRGRQDETWDPVLDWLRDRLGARLNLSEGIMPVAQPPTALAAIHAAFSQLDPFRLTAAHSSARIVNSAALALALIEGRLDAPAIADMAGLDESYQLETWGEDEDARALLTRRRVDLVEIGRFLELLN